MKFLVVTNAPTLYKDGKFLAYAPYVNEMDIWFENVDKVGIISPATYPVYIYEKAFVRQDFNFFKLPFLRISSSLQIIRFLFLIPILKIKIIKSFLWADHIHLRGPGNICLLGCLLQIFFPHKPKTAKYAGNWDPNSKQPWSYNLQKWILSNTFLTRNMKVLVYGQWQNQTKNILPFFTASFNENEKEVVIKDFNPPYKFLFVGGLVAGKQPLVALQLVEALNRRCIPCELHIYGDGPLKNEIENETEIKDYIHLHDNQPLEVLKQAYKDAHFLILASKSEGWPKAVAEGMFFGCIPIATAVSCVPWMLGGGSRGILVSPAPEVGAKEKWFEKIVMDVLYLINNPEKMRRMSLEAQEWSQEYTLEKFEAEIKKLLVVPPAFQGGAKK